MATSGSGKASSAPKKAPLPRERPSSAPKKVPLPRELPSTSTRKRLEGFKPIPTYEGPEIPPHDYRTGVAGNRAGVSVKASKEKKTAGSKGRNAGRVSRFSRSMDDTPNPKKSGNPRGGNRSGVKMK